MNNEQPRTHDDLIASGDAVASTTVICTSEEARQRALADGFTDEEITMVADIGEACDVILGDT